MATPEDSAAVFDDARRVLREGNPGQAVRSLRIVAEDVPLVPLASFVAEAAEAIGFDDLVQAAHAVAMHPDTPQALYDWGYCCIERGVGFLAIPALREALLLVPESAVLSELVAALSDEGRYAEAVQVIETQPQLFVDWFVLYLLAFNSLMAGDIDRAAATFTQMGPPKDAQFGPSYQRIGLMLRRANLVAATQAGTLDGEDLRGWHFALNASVLIELSPYGAEDMHGRYAYTQDSLERCRVALDQLRAILGTGNIQPKAVVFLPDRDSEILSRAAGLVLDLPVHPFQLGEEDALVVAYSLATAAPEVVEQLQPAVHGQILYEHACCWTDAPFIAADIVGYLCQTNVVPWAPGGKVEPEDTISTDQADDRPAAAVAAEIAALPMRQLKDDQGNLEQLTAFVGAVAPMWATVPVRDRMWSPGPVASNRFV